jgi:hypothetical protein
MIFMRAVPFSDRSSSSRRLLGDHARFVVAVQAGQEKVYPEKGKEEDTEAKDG